MGLGCGADGVSTSKVIGLGCTGKCLDRFECLREVPGVSVWSLGAVVVMSTRVRGWEGGWVGRVEGWVVSDVAVRG